MTVCFSATSSDAACNSVHGAHTCRFRQNDERTRYFNLVKQRMIKAGTMEDVVPIQCEAGHQYMFSNFCLATLTQEARWIFDEVFASSLTVYSRVLTVYDSAPRHTAFSHSLFSLLEFFLTNDPMILWSISVALTFYRVTFLGELILLRLALLLTNC